MKTALNIFAMDLKKKSIAVNRITYIGLNSIRWQIILIYKSIQAEITNYSIFSKGYSTFSPYSDNSNTLQKK